MKLSINVSNIMTRYDASTSFNLYKNAGFDAMDFSLCDIINPTSPFFGDEWRAAYPELESTLGDNPAAPWNNKIRGNVFRSNAMNFLFDPGTIAVTNRMVICQ